MFSNLLPGACSVNAGPTPLCLLLIQKTTLVNTWCPVHTPRPFRELPSLKVLTLDQVNTRCFSQRKALVFQLPQGPDVPAPARPSQSTLRIESTPSNQVLLVFRPKHGPLGDLFEITPTWSNKPSGKLFAHPFNRLSPKSTLWLIIR